MYTVYIRTDEQGRVEDVNSSAFLVDPAGWTAVCSGDGDRFVHAQGNFFAKPVRDERGICQYRMVKTDAYTAGEDRVVASFESEGIPYVLYERTEEEMTADEQIKGGIYMANIKINGTVIENVSLTVSPNLLGMNFETNMSLDELAALFDAETAPEIRVLDAAGNTTAMYKNRKLTTLQLETISGTRRVSIALQVTPLEVSGEGSADVAALQAEVNELKAALAAIEEGIADA